MERKDGFKYWQDYFQELNKKENRNNAEIAQSRVSEITHSNFFSVAENVTFNLVTPIEYERVGLRQLNPKALERITSPGPVAKSVVKGPNTTPDPSSVAEIGKIESMVGEEIAKINDTSPSWAMAKASHDLQSMAEKTLQKRIADLRKAIE
jgi:hypothetical protein